MSEKEKVKYYSTDKMYTANNKKGVLSSKIWCYTLLVLSTLLLVLGVYCIASSIEFNGKKVNVDYQEKGNADYTVYLKENNYYDSKYLKSGMKYVASLINTINAKFNYEIKSDKNVEYTYTYKINGTLQIVDKDDKNKVLYTKDDVLLNEVTKKVNSNRLVINEDLDIDYGKYNNYVNAYKREYGLIVDSQLILTMDVTAKADRTGSKEKLEKKNQLQITIPLSEQTVDIKIDTVDINNKGSLATPTGSSIINPMLFVTGVIIFIISIIGYAIDKMLYKEYASKNIYDITVNKILREYDRLIVNGKATISESKYNNIIYPDKFSEMADAAQNLGVPIWYYEVIPNEKSFFIIAKEDTLYKYRITKAYLERKVQKNIEENREEDNRNKILSDKEVEMLEDKEKKEKFSFK